MLETQEQIDSTLSICGEVLKFSNGDLLGIPGHTVFNVQSFDSVYDVEKQEFDFQVSNLKFTELGVEVTDCFLYTLSKKDYKFEIISFVDDLVGWFNLNVKLVEVTYNV